MINIFFFENIFRVFRKKSNLEALNGVIYIYLPFIWGLCLAYNEYISKNAICIAMLCFFILSLALWSFFSIIKCLFEQKRLEVTLIFFAFFWLCIGFFVLQWFNVFSKLLMLFIFLFTIVYYFVRLKLKLFRQTLASISTFGVFIGYAVVMNNLNNSSILLWFIGIYWFLLNQILFEISEFESKKTISIIGKNFIMIIICLILIGIMENMSRYFYLSIIVELFFALRFIYRAMRSNYVDNMKNELIFIGFFIILQIFLGKI